MKNSEILQDIHVKISSIESLLKLNDYQQKLILTRLNNLNVVKKETVENVKPFSPGKVVSPDPTPEVARNDIIDKKNKLMTINKDKGSDSYNNYNFEKELNDITKKNTNSKELNSDEQKKFPVSQKIAGKTGKVISSASVVIKNSDGEIIEKIKTNSSGRWMAMLPIGKYVVDVSGKDGKEFISYVQSFEVMLSSNLPIILPMPEMYKRYVEE